MVEKELGLVIEEGPGPLRGALVMGGAFGLASIVPILPYLFLPIAIAPVAALVLCGVVVFGIGIVKTRWTKRDPIRSGVEVMALAAFAGIAGYLFGSVLPTMLGYAGLGAV
jgi:VIT1/CCC1 family predicted Fe2+/Mn2+ transporter